MIKPYRNGPLGALMDEYERATQELKTVLKIINQNDFIKIVDPSTKDPDCRSIQTIINHVVRSGYGYSNYIRKQFGDKWIERKDNYKINSPEIACDQLNKMLRYTSETFDNKWDLSLDNIANTKIITTWGQTYDVEQLLEHAIVHILRHRRQIEQFRM